MKIFPLLYNSPNVFLDTKKNHFPFTSKNIAKDINVNNIFITILLIFFLFFIIITIITVIVINLMIFK